MIEKVGLNYPDTSKVWIFPFTEKLKDSNTLKDTCHHFLKQWDSHGKSLKASFEIVYDQFLIFFCDENVTPLTGCAQDRLLHELPSLEQINNIKFCSNTDIIYRDQHEHIQAIKRTQFNKALKRNQIFDKNTIVFDQTISNLGELRSGKWETQLCHTWKNTLLEKYNP